MFVFYFLVGGVLWEMAEYDSKCDGVLFLA